MLVLLPLIIFSDDGNGEAGRASREEVLPTVRVLGLSGLTSPSTIEDGGRRRAARRRGCGGLRVLVAAVWPEKLSQS